MDGSNLQKWRNEESTPKADLYLAVAEYFGVTTDYLYGRDLPASADHLTELTPEEKRLIESLRETAPQKVRMALGVMAVLLREELD